MSILLSSLLVISQHFASYVKIGSTTTWYNFIFVSSLTFLDDSREFRAWDAEKTLCQQFWEKTKLQKTYKLYRLPQTSNKYVTKTTAGQNVGALAQTGVVCCLHPSEARAFTITLIVSLNHGICKCGLVFKGKRTHTHRNARSARSVWQRLEVINSVRTIKHNLRSAQFCYIVLLSASHTENVIYPLLHSSMFTRSLTGFQQIIRFAC